MDHDRLLADSACASARRDAISSAAALIDYFAGNEPLLLALCANNGLSPDDFMRVWAKLNPAG